MIKVWLGEQLLIIDKTGNTNEFDYILDAGASSDYQSFITTIWEDQLWKKSLIYGDDEQSVLLRLKTEFICLEAAGGLVKNPDAKYLFI